MATVAMGAGFFVVMISFMAVALHFSHYKQKGDCCSAGFEELEAGLDGCGTCPRKDTEECPSHETSDEACETVCEDDGANQKHSW